MIDQFKQDVLEGLSASPKRLSSKYFYDEIGDQLFQKIMTLPEYYLTRAEAEIFQNQSKEIIADFKMDTAEGFDLIELGAGDGTKTMELIKELINQKATFSYHPIDISQHALDGLEKSLSETMPSLQVVPQQGMYFEVLEKLSHFKKPKVVIFLGSNLGNLNDKDASEFIFRLGESLNPSDKLLLGLDLKKSKDIVLPAYNDASGVTRAFNLNLLTRINKELGADFNIEKFDHTPEYDEGSGIARSSITSLAKQVVTISSLSAEFQFEEGEKIHTEISRKYDKQILTDIIGSTNFKVIAEYYDSNNYYSDIILEKG